MRKFYKINQYIRSPQVRLIIDGGENVGVVKLEEAQFKARQMGLDLVQVTEKIEPPVCKIIDFRKFRYIQQKKEQSGKKNSRSAGLKEVRFTPFIGQADFEARMKKIRAFLEDGDKVKLTVKFTGRQITRKDFGDRVINQAVQELDDTVIVEQQPKLQGKMLYMIVKPKK